MGGLMSSHDEMPDEELWERSQSDELEDRADALLELAHRARNREDFQVAKSLYGSALDLFVELERDVDAGVATYSLGYCQYRLSEYEEAIESLQASLAKGQQINDSKAIAFSAGPLGDSYSAIGKTAKAIHAYDLAVDTFVEIDEYTQAGINGLSLGELHGLEGRQTRALECFIRAFNVFQEGGDGYGAARAKDRMASALIELGDFDQALMHIKDALEIFTFMDKEERIAHMNYRLGWTLNLAGKYLQAEAPLRLAIRLFRENQDWSRAGMAEVQLAYSLMFRDLEADQTEAQGLLNRAAAYFEAAGEQLNVLMANSVIAERLMNEGSFVEAAALWRDILNRAISYEDSFSARSAMASLAECLFEIGEHTEGKQVFSEIDASEWGENKPELERIERIKKLMFEKLAETLNIEIPR
jgi:tetratricopeptide (TPR) repeat protein